MSGALAAPESSPDLSIVVPMFNEAANLDAFFRRLDGALTAVGLRIEIVCVDDGSADDTWQRLVERQAGDRRLRLVRLSRNFGKDIALSAGLQHAAGRAAVPIDADLQHPPELIAVFVAKWREGYDMVYAVRRSRATDSWLRRTLSVTFYRLFARLADVEMPLGAGDFCLLDRRVVDALNAMPERARFMKGLFAWVGFRHIGIEYEPGERAAGGSSWSLARLAGFAVDGLASFTTFPLVVAGYIGAVLAVPSLLLGIFFTVRTLVWGVDVPGYASVMVAVLMLGSIQLLTLGLFGAYLGRVFAEVKGRPLYVVSERRGFAEPAVTRSREDPSPMSGQDGGAQRADGPAALAVPAPARAAGGDP